MTQEALSFSPIIMQLGFLIVSLLLAVASGLPSKPPGDAQSCCFKIDDAEQYIDPNTGRAMLFHGVNVVYKVFPYYPTNDSFDPQLSLSEEDVDFLVANGFNVVRLYVAWPGLEPTLGNYNLTYLEIIADMVTRLGERGIFTILDCHQDLFSPKFCGEGAPDFAVLYPDPPKKPLPFPLPISLKPFSVDPTTGYPYRNECSLHSFFVYYFSDATGKAWQSFYNNEQQIQDQFALFWGVVAKRFTGNPYVLGYELLNEPWAGDIYSHPSQLEPHVSDPHNLMPLYAKLHTAIRQYDNDHIIFFEPTVMVTQLPFGGFSSTGLTEGPGGPEYNDRQVFSYHMYCLKQSSSEEPYQIALCDYLDEDIMGIRMGDLQRLQLAGFMTEWGAYDTTQPYSNAYEDALELTGLADLHLQPWTYWQYKGYGDITTQSDTGEGLWFNNGTLDVDKLKLLSRTYAQAVAGRYVSQSFNAANGDFVLTFEANVTISSPTVIFLNEQLYYPNGYSVMIVPSNAASYTKTPNQLVITFQPQVTSGQIIYVTVKTM
ncbi:hypothetical protein EMCRGX_G022389 [Ephydatia muelleri]